MSGDKSDSPKAAQGPKMEVEVLSAAQLANHPVLGKLTQLIQQAGHDHKRPEPVGPEEALALFLRAEWRPALGDVVVLRKEFDCTQPVLQVDTEYIITQLLDPPARFGTPEDPDSGKRYDCGLAVRINHGSHFHFHEVLCDSRNLVRVGTIADQISSYEQSAPD